MEKYKTVKIKNNLKKTKLQEQMKIMKHSFPK